MENLNILSKDELIKKICVLKEIVNHSVQENDKLRDIASDKMENQKIFKDIEQKANKFHKLEYENQRLNQKLDYFKKENNEQYKQIQKLANENEELRQK